MVVKRYTGRTVGGELGNRKKAWKALKEKYNACSNATRQELYDSLNNTNLHRGQDPDEFLYHLQTCLLYTSPSPRDGLLSRMPSSA